MVWAEAGRPAGLLPRLLCDGAEPGAFLCPTVFSNAAKTRAVDTAGLWLWSVFSSFSKLLYGFNLPQTLWSPVFIWLTCVVAQNFEPTRLPLRPQYKSLIVGTESLLITHSLNLLHSTNAQISGCETHSSCGSSVINTSCFWKEVKTRLLCVFWKVSEPYCSGSQRMGRTPQVAWSYCTRRRSMQSIFIFWYFLQLFVTEYHHVCPLVMFQCSTQTSDCYYLNPAWSHVSLWICMLINSYLKINQPEGYFSEQIQVQTNFWFDLQTSLSPKLLHRTVRSSVWDNDSGVHTRYRK